MKTGCRYIYVEEGAHYVRIEQDGQLMMRKLRSMLQSGAVKVVPVKIVLELIESHLKLGKELKKQTRELEAIRQELEITKKQRDRYYDDWKNAGTEDLWG